jgi:hypothetical protein
MKTILKYTKLIFLGLILLSCTKDYEEINTNPQGFTTASSGSLFNGVVQSLYPSGNELFYINNEILQKQTQLSALTHQAWGNYTLGTEDIWKNYYLAYANIRELESRFSEYENSPESNNMKAMLKIVVAYKTFKVTDLFGDIPFSEASMGFQNPEFLRPQYDKQRDIYFSLLEDLKWCDEHIDPSATAVEPIKSFLGFDKLFFGDLLMWQKFANSLRLRYAMRMSEKEPEMAAEIISDIISNDRPIIQGYDFISYVGESACLWPSQQGYSYDAPNWSMREHKNLRMGSNIWSQLSYHDSTDGSGIFDPRAYIFFETNNASEWVYYPQSAPSNQPAPGGIAYDVHRDNVAAFEVKGESCIYSVFNFFLHRDNRNMPVPLITGAEVHYILAEAYYKGIGVAEDPAQADIEYMNGINSSVEWWLNVAENSTLPLSGLAFTDKIQIPNYLNASSVLGKFGSWNALTVEEKLNFIYTQRWIDAFLQPQEAYALTRRTNSTPREGEPIQHFRLPYPPSEQEFNSENWLKAKEAQGGDDFDVKIWWIPNGK